MAEKVKVIEKSDLERLISGVLLIEIELDARILKGGDPEIVKLFKEVRSSAEILRDDLKEFRNYKNISMIGVS